MNDASRDLRRWLNFAGFVLVFGVLYWLQVVFIPLALAVIFALILSPLAGRLQHWIGRVASVLVTVVLFFAVLSLSVWALANQVTHLLSDIPVYKETIIDKLDDVRQLARGGSVDSVQEAIAQIQNTIEQPGVEATSFAVPFVESPGKAWSVWTFAGVLGPVMGPLATAGLVTVLVIFLLLERDGIRRRLIDLIGHGNLAVTTRAIDEAGRRVSHQLLMQALVSAIYAVGVGVGLYFIGVPYAFLWAALAFFLRFIPYVGPFIAAGAPILVALATLPGWERPLVVIVLFVVLELFTNLVLETYLYAGSAGVSPFALLVALAFWTWLWGPVGLLLGTPLTICVVVLGKHVPRFGAVSAFMAEESTLPPDMNYYQRLLAHDPGDAFDIIGRHIEKQADEDVFDALLLPSLNYAERDHFESRLSSEEQGEILSVTDELISDAAAKNRAARALLLSGSAESIAKQNRQADSERVPVLAWPANDRGDALALRMLGHLLEDAAIELDIISHDAFSSDIIKALVERKGRILCIADLPPSPPARTRYLVKKLRAALPELTILVGRWAPPALADDRPELLLESGANHVGTTLIETRDRLVSMVPRSPSASSASSASKAG